MLPCSVHASFPSPALWFDLHVCSFVISRMLCRWNHIASKIFLFLFFKSVTINPMANSLWSFFNQWVVVPDGRYTTAFVSHRLQGHLGCFQRQAITSKATISALIFPCVCLCTCICAHIYMEASDNFRCHSSGLLLLGFLSFCPCFWHFISQWPGASLEDEACQPVIYLSPSTQWWH